MAIFPHRRRFKPIMNKTVHASLHLSTSVDRWRMWRCFCVRVEIMEWKRLTFFKLRIFTKEKPFTLWVSSSQALVIHTSSVNCFPICCFSPADTAMKMNLFLQEIVNWVSSWHDVICVNFSGHRNAVHVRISCKWIDFLQEKNLLRTYWSSFTKLLNLSEVFKWNKNPNMKYYMIRNTSAQLWQLISMDPSPGRLLKKIASPLFLV